jgi:hypothetical protein
MIICSCLILTGCGSNKKDNKKDNSKEEVVNVPEDTVISFSDEKVSIPEGSHLDKLYNILTNYGKKIYQDKAYEGLEKKNEMYFASLKQLKEKFSYDVSSFVGEDGTVCDVDESGIYFDIDNKMNYKYNEDFLPILPTLVKCSASEVKDNSQQ